MRSGRVIAGVAALATVVAGLTLTADANAWRKPTAKEKREIAREVLVDLERELPTHPGRILGPTRVSTLRASATSPYARFALTTAGAVDDMGNAFGDTPYYILGYSKRFKTWAILGFGTSDVACARSEAKWFGGRRDAIFRDLNLERCTR